MKSYMVLEKFVEELAVYKNHEENKNEPKLIKDIKRISDALLDPKFYPSEELKRTLKKQLRRARYPLEIAIVGQFSSGKSTFLNALIAKNILPTGITPVTSKVNYINYGNEYKLKITFKSGAEEFTPIEMIDELIDQRKSELNNIQYLTLYAPIEILKDISFVDTPGLNSLSNEDTSITKNILRDVGGIIWLTLIDNAGKRSEELILKEYIKQFQSKSLCVLNQKDRFSEEQVTLTTDYVKKSFADYFAKVIPISAKMALESRENHKNFLIEDEYRSLSEEIETTLLNNGLEDTNDIYDLIERSRNKVIDIKQSDSSKNKENYKESNIAEVLDFIENSIRPMANESKEYALKNGLRDICDILISEYKSIIHSYDKLIEVFTSNLDGILNSIENIREKYENSLFDVYEKIESIVEDISSEIHKNIKTIQKEKINEKKGLFNKKIINVTSYNISWIDSDLIYKNLFYDDDKIEKKFKKVVKNLTQLEELISSDLQNIFNFLQNEVKQWQEPFQLVKKHREIASNFEFSTTRHFAAKVHENILNHFEHLIQSSILDVSNNFAYFNGALSYSYIAITKSTVAYFKRKIRQTDELQSIEEKGFTQYKPNLKEIKLKLKSNFKYEKIDDFLTSKNNFLNKTISKLNTHYIKNNTDRINFINEHKENYLKKIEDLEEIKSSI